MKKNILAILFIIFVINAIAADLPKEVISWKGVMTATDPMGHEIKFLYFPGASYTDDQGGLPILTLQYPLASADVIVTARLVNPVYEELDTEEIAAVGKDVILPADILPSSERGMIQKKSYAMISLVPIRLNPLTKKAEKLISFQIELFEAPNPIPEPAIQAGGYAANSVLATGNWFKLALTQNGIYKLTYTDLKDMGMNMSSLDPRDIRVYGNGSKPLPESNAGARYDDLRENAIQVIGQEDGIFDESDYVLFYGSSPYTWVYNTSKKRFVHKVNYYTDYTYYFLTADHGPGQRISEAAPSSLSPNQTVDQFNDYSVHDLDQLNLIKSGKIWYGEKFDLKLTYDLPNFSFPNLVEDSLITMEVDVAARSTMTSYFKVYVDNGEAASINVAAYSPISFNSDYALTATSVKKFLLNKSTVPVRVSYVPYVSGSIGWLNYIEFHALRKLQMVDHQMHFRHLSSWGPGKVTRFVLSGNIPGTRIWEITDPTRPLQRPYDLVAGTMQFVVPTDSLREFIGFEATGFLSIHSSQKIANQDLHAFEPRDMLIVYAPEFEQQAKKLAGIHEDRGLSVQIVTPAEIYNEFSSGCQDISAIRDFSRMLYTKSDPGQGLQYLLFFGDASYDYKNRMPANTNFIPTFQSLNSLRPTESYATDDFFGLLDANEGDNCMGNLDLGIGRLPVKTAKEADDAVRKIERYVGLSSSSGSGSGFANNVPRLSDWRNSICFVADDEDSDMHIDQAEEMADLILQDHYEYNIDKVYFDAYTQEATPGGSRYPAVTEDINKRVSKGALIVNYTGHGGETGWAHERVLEVADINAWENTQSMPVFVTATCEFSRFDDPERSSAGEYAFLNPNGGAISLFTTTRLSFAATNFALNMKFYQHAFTKINGEDPRMGDVIRKAKTPSNPQILNFVLLGDPALAMAYPHYDVETSSLNGQPIGTDSDTVKAFSLVTVTGYIKDDNGDKVTSFNGTLYPTVFDKPVEITTLANDVESFPRTFELQKSVIYKGKTSVINGEFTFSFYVPRDIAYKYGQGKISYYAEDGITDANGYFDDFIIGGSESKFDEDIKGPEVVLFMNDTNFIAGGMTDENPILLAIVSDEHGINTVGNGIGHDIVAILDDQTDKSVVLNDFYEAQLNSYQRGFVKYPYSKLSEGHHTVSVKVWDVYNNSAEAITDFYVVKSGNVTIENLMNYPNPFFGGTSFEFNHNQSGGSLEVDIMIFSMTGEVVKNLHTTIFPDGFHAGPIPWDGRNDHGIYIAKGLYIYRITITNEDGRSQEKSAKLVVLN